MNQNKTPESKIKKSSFSNKDQGKPPEKHPQNTQEIPKRWGFEEYVDAFGFSEEITWSKTSLVRNFFFANEPRLDYLEQKLKEKELAGRKYMDETAVVYQENKQLREDIQILREENKLLLERKLYSRRKLESDNKSLREAFSVLLKAVKLRNKIIEAVYEHCLCERSTEGFDYHEHHPRRGDMKGSRVKTPRALIEDWIGYEWSEGGVYPRILNTKKTLESESVKRVLKNNQYQCAGVEEHS